MKYFFLCVLGVMLALTSCEKIALEDEGTMVAPSDEGFGMASLTVTTRIGGGDENAVNAGCIYIFNQDGDCVQILSTDDESNTINLPAGAYSLYAVGGEDLGRFVLPTQANATTTSIITLKSGSVMDDLLMNSANVELEDGESTTQNIVLERKGRGGKQATIVTGFVLDDASLKQVASALKRSLGVGGSARGSEILIQGDFRQRVLDELTSMGFKARII